MSIGALITISIAWSLIGSFTIYFIVKAMRTQKIVEDDPDDDD